MCTLAEHWEGHSEVREMISLQQEGMSVPVTAHSSEEEEPSTQLSSHLGNKFAALLHMDDSD